VALLNRAIEHDPRFGLALALAAWCHIQLETLGVALDLEANQRRGLELARRAITAAPDDPTVLGTAAMTLARFANELEPARALVDRALEINPSFARGWYISGWVKNFAGQLDLAIEDYEQSARLNPRSEREFIMFSIDTCHFFAGRFEEAAANLEVAREQLPYFAAVHRFLAASYAHMGRIGRAREVFEELRAITPIPMQRRVNQWRNPQHGELFLSGLRLAAGEAE
jgi:tetratricopeptide (TPR) repeat protein